MIKVQKCICIVNLQVMGANGFVTTTINGHSTPNTFIGFKTALVMNLEKKINKTDACFKTDSLNSDSSMKIKKNVIQIFHKVYQANSDSHKTDESQYKESKMVPKTIMDNKVLNEDVSFIFEFYINIEKKQKIETLINKEIQKMRFGGGFIKKSKAKLIVEKEIDKNGNEIDVMKEISKSVKKGFVMKECHDNINNIDDLINSLKIKKLKFKLENEESVWKTATILGYALLNEAEKTEFSKFKHKHAFAEPLIGVVEFEFFHKYMKEVTYENFFEIGWKTVFEKINDNDNGIIRYTTNEQKSNNK